MAKDNGSAHAARRGRGALGLLVSLMMIGGAGAVSAADAVVDPTPLDAECAVPASALSLGAGMPAIVAALRAGQDVDIVALGSSSTEGAGATSPEMSYPSRLAAELRERFPDTRINVVNRGIGGQLARQMVDRLGRDALEAKPELVIWQTGTNDALALIDRAEFRSTLIDGIDRLQAAGIDVVLMDLQYYPKSRQSDTYERYVEAMSGVAREERIGLFGRYAMMRHWAAAERSLWAGDQFHLGNLGYHCVAAVLAEAIERQVDAVQRAEAAPVVPVMTAAK